MTDSRPTRKQTDLDPARVHYEDTTLTTNTGTRLSDTDNSLRAGERGPTLLEDFHAREKITHFDHERIPERVVHARATKIRLGGPNFEQLPINRPVDTATNNQRDGYGRQQIPVGRTRTRRTRSAAAR